eukprot:Blabericola_migrator_1__12489@NODE_78_length_15130_cov_126_174401_g70_i0_p6_GENE_NODE_78_length_15130_cov_126_174401_g70_i0NODE_78_length_15130_cov_126_174401_g70_i0_p6_ORF_typecomplete_len332_score42_24_NODE_78_length_15130_cov_126_174401_g70_i01332614321
MLSKNLAMIDTTEFLFLLWPFADAQLCAKLSLTCHSFRAWIFTRQRRWILECAKHYPILYLWARPWWRKSWRPNTWLYLSFLIDRWKTEVNERLHKCFPPVCEYNGICWRRHRSPEMDDLLFELRCLSGKYDLFVKDEIAGVMYKRDSTTTRFEGPALSAYDKWPTRSLTATHHLRTFRNAIDLLSIRQALEKAEFVQTLGEYRINWRSFDAIWGCHPFRIVPQSPIDQFKCRQTSAVPLSLLWRNFTCANVVEMMESWQSSDSQSWIAEYQRDSFDRIKERFRETTERVRVNQPIHVKRLAARNELVICLHSDEHLLVIWPADYIQRECV